MQARRWPGLFLVNFLTEPVGLSPPNFTEPDGKTASPTKNNHFDFFTFCVTVWFFSTVTLDENIMQKLEELAKFWKKLPEGESLQLFAKRFQRFFRKKTDIHLTFSIGIEILKSGKMEKVVKISAKLFLFKSLSFPNRLSYRCQIGPKWKLFWSTFWEKLNRQTFFEFWMHLVNWKSILQTIYPETTKSFMFGRITLFKNRCLCFSPKTTSKYLSFETNLGSVAQTVQKW